MIFCFDYIKLENDFVWDCERLWWPCYRIKHLFEKLLPWSCEYRVSIIVQQVLSISYCSFIWLSGGVVLLTERNRCKTFYLCSLYYVDWICRLFLYSVLVKTLYIIYVSQFLIVDFKKNPAMSKVFHSKFGVLFFQYSIFPFFAQKGSIAIFILFYATTIQ